LSEVYGFAIGIDNGIAVFTPRELALTGVFAVAGAVLTIFG
jgi:hypothetical protein